MRKKGLVKEEALSDLTALYPPSQSMQVDLEKLDAAYEGIRLPAVLGTRTQEGNKTRDVWGVSILQVIFEQRYYRPYLNLAKSRHWRSVLIGPDAVAMSITSIIRHALREGLKLVSIDFSRYDQSISKQLQEAAFDYISQSFQRQFWPELRFIAKMFNRVPLITPDGVWHGSHGVPSGSTWTNEVDSVVQYLIAKEVDDEENFNIQGDDGAYATSDPERLKEAFQSYGLEVNEDKSDISDFYLVYLQNYFSPKYERKGIIGGIYPVYRALNRLVHMERWDSTVGGEGISGDDFFSIRALAILENCKHHPLFRRLVEFVHKHDKRDLRFSDQGLTEYVRNVRSKGSQVAMNQYGDFVSGVRAFESFKILSELS